MWWRTDPAAVASGGRWGGWLKPEIPGFSLHGGGTRGIFWLGEFPFAPYRSHRCGSRGQHHSWKGEFMRHTLVTCGVLVLMICGPARAGTVHFNPPSATITPGTQSVSFDVSVSWETMPTIDTVNVVIFADYGAGLDFDFAQSFLDSTTLPPAPPATQSWYCDFGDCLPSVGFGGNRLAPIAPVGWMSPLFIGTLTVATDQLLAHDQIRVFVDSQQEIELFGAAFSVVQDANFNQEPLSGLATITVVPEPATMGVLLILTCLAMYRRKQVFA